MDIKINGKKFSVYDYDDDNTIIERYVLSVSDDRALPQYFRIVDKDFVLSAGLELTVKDVRDTINTLSVEDLNNPTIIDTMLSIYPSLKKKEIGMLWIKKNYSFIEEGATMKVATPIDIDNLKLLDRYTFTTSKRAEIAVVEYNIAIPKIRSLLSSKIDREAKIFGKIANVEAVKSSAFILEDVVSVFNVSTVLNIMELFDSIKVSREIPFVIVRYRSNEYYKVYKPIVPLPEWLEMPATSSSKGEKPKDGIYIKVLNTSLSKLSSKQPSLDNMYSDAFWKLDNSVEIAFKVKMGVTEDEIHQRVLNSFGADSPLRIISTMQKGIKGKFHIHNFEANRAILADLIALDGDFKYFLFFNEHTKSIMEKARFYLYYSPNQDGNIDRSLTLTMTQQGDNIDVRISHALNYQQANASRIIISKLLSLYKQREQAIGKIYTELVSSFTLSTKKKKTEKVDKKTGPRAFALRAFNPELFGARYPDQCQKDQQPQVISEEEAKERVQELGDEHKVMYFKTKNEEKGGWYICDPREIDDKTPNHTWPGLKANTSKLDKTYIESYPLLPCCYIQDQYKKTSSNLKKFIQNSDVSTAEGEKEGGMGYVVISNKKIPSGRFGEMPFNWEKLLKPLMKKVTKGKQEFYPILRFGVMPSPDSLIHCLERATNPRYSSYTSEERKIMVKNAREALVSNPLGYAKQELFDMDEDVVKSMLLDPKQYIAPETFCSLLEKHYGCNIYIYVVDEERPNGDIVLPRHSNVYLCKDRSKTQPSILIIKYDAGIEDYPYQCEIACEVAIKDGKFKGVNFIFENSPLVEMAIKMLNETNEVYIVSQEGYELYTPIPFDV